MSAPLLAIDSLCVSIGGERILDSVSLQVASGETLGLVGASGSGKSMTALAVMRLLPGGARVGGSVSLKGEPLAAMSERELRSVRGREIGTGRRDARIEVRHDQPFSGTMES